MKAEEARKLVEAYQDRDDIAVILAEIKASARVGRESHEVAVPLTKGQLNALKELGYWVIGNKIIW